MENFFENPGLYYYILAWFATLFFVVKLFIFQFFGMDTGSEVSTDFSDVSDTDSSFSFVSLQSILAFLMGFGWMGYTALQFNLEQLEAFTAAMIVGFIFMFTMAFLMFSVKKLEKTVIKDKKTALNKIGKSYSAFKPNGNGQIEIEINGQLTVTDAVNNTDKTISSFDSIKVVKVENDQLYVEKVK